MQNVRVCKIILRKSILITWHLYIKDKSQIGNKTLISSIVQNISCVEVLLIQHGFCPITNCIDTTHHCLHIIAAVAAAAAAVAAYHNSSSSVLQRPRYPIV